MRTIALIGEGNWGQKLIRYIPRTFILKYVANSKTDLDVILNDDHVDGVIIATPVKTHATLIKKCIENRKHIFVEKPMAMYSGDVSYLGMRAHENNLKIVTDYIQTFSNLTKILKSKLPTIGKVKYIDMRWEQFGRFDRENIYYLCASHCLSILVDIGFEFENRIYRFDHLLSPTGTCVSGSILNNEFNISVSVDNPNNKYHGLCVHGELGTIECNYTDGYLKTYYYSKDKSIEYDVVTDVFHSDENHNIQLALEYFNDVLDGKQEDNLELSIKVSKLLEDLNE